MPISNYPKGFADGVNIRGVPILNTYPGVVYWVDSVYGSNGNTKGTFDRPFATIDYAIGRCTASRNDVILVKPGHSETISAAAGIAADVIGVTILGLGNGTLRPIVTFSATASTFTVTAANVTIANIQFQNAIDSLVSGIPITAAGCSITGCAFTQPTITNDALMWILTTTAADDLIVQGNTFRQSNAGPTECIRLVGADRAMITDNYIIGSYSTAAINGITTASTELLIARNTICNSVTDKLAIDLVAACTGRIEYNSGTVVSTAAITDANIIDAANCQLAQNYFSDAVGETGKLIGTVSA